MSGKATLSAGLTAPFSDTTPASNHALNSPGVSEVAQVVPASGGTVCCVSA